MSGQSAMVPRYMAQLLQELGWNLGTRIPLANPHNQTLENLLIDRQNEVQRLKEALILQNQKRDDLNKYKNHVQTEYQENTRLLFAHKQQMEQEVKLRQLSLNEANRLDRDVVDCCKQNNVTVSRIDNLQNNIARLLKKADTLKSEVCGERGALQEWRAALERSAGDIIAIEQFTKQDLSRAKALETQRQKLKLEHDQLQERLNQLVSNLSAEERACERISFQVMEGMEQRKQMMAMWANAVENLRQRDTDIRHIREDYAVLDAEANNLAEKCREQQSFCDQQRGNNLDAERENMALANQLSQTRMAFDKTAEHNVTLDSEARSLQREVSNIRIALEKLHMENRQLMDNQHRKDVLLQAVVAKIKELKEKLKDSTDKSKSSERRARELEDMLNEEERYASQVTTNQQRAMHCSFVEQQKLLALKNEEKLFHMQFKASKAIMSKLDTKQAAIERNLQTQKESLYAICYQVETLGARVLHMEGEKAERECSAELAARENRLKDVLARHTARVALLERHSGKLFDDMRRLARELEVKGVQHTNLQSRLKTSMLNVEGGEKDVRSLRDVWRRARVDEALMRLRVAHGERALAGLGDAAFTLDKQRLQLDAAMNERLVEIAARREMFAVQRRALVEECGKLRGDIREREQRIQQLIKRYEIFIGSLGKDESGQQMSVTYFKIKFAAERAELREAGAALDADIGRQEKDISALEATLRVVHAAHKHFLHHISPLTSDAPEMEEVSELLRQYYEKRDELKALNAEIERIEQTVNERSSQLTLLGDKYKQLTAREVECENELDTLKERVDKQDSRLQKAHELARTNARRATKLIEGVDDWRIFQLALWIRNYSEAAHNCLQALGEVAQQTPNAAPRVAVLLSASQVARFVTPTQRRLMTLLQRLITGGSTLKKESTTALDESVFSESAQSSGTDVSLASGYTRRLAAFRKELAPKVQEHALINDIREQARRSSVSLRVVTLGLEESVPATAPAAIPRKSLR
ncbi:coiled-coil domain-containing protein 39 isoform X2 [Maniola jurtina]|uniref:coiled-coil domain-containing protein 39 isoform X2 n=1 Tax=Maniola jurtina TaxID=191418 RepID=UPI001E689422|nr:coiled-coil domain-containing protein 39 isoform X2 [Maniola jurtina]